MPAALLGRKLGMTRYFTENGTNLPVTVIEAGPCAVTQVKTTESDEYAAVQLAFDDVKPRRSSQPLIGHDHKAGVSPKRWHQEFPFRQVSGRSARSTPLDSNKRAAARGQPLNNPSTL